MKTMYLSLVGDHEQIVRRARWLISERSSMRVKQNFIIDSIDAYLCVSVDLQSEGISVDPQSLPLRSFLYRLFLYLWFVLIEKRLVGDSGEAEAAKGAPLFFLFSSSTLLSSLETWLARSVVALSPSAALFMQFPTNCNDSHAVACAKGKMERGRSCFYC